jgi:hypothetical protein
MTERAAKDGLGLFLIASHIAIVGLLLGEFVAGGFSFKDMTTAIALVAPMFTAYTAVVVKYFTDNRIAAADRSATLSGAFVTLMFGVACLFVVLVVGSILLFAANVGFSSFEQLKAVLAILEGAYGLYLGKVVEALFPRSPGGGARRSAAAASTAGRHSP